MHIYTDAHLFGQEHCHANTGAHKHKLTNLSIQNKIMFLENDIFPCIAIVVDSRFVNFKYIT